MAVRSILLCAVLLVTVLVDARRPDVLDEAERERIAQYKKRIPKEFSLEEALAQTDELTENFDETAYIVDQEGYRGVKNEEGFKHGTGSLQNPEGDSYVGQWKRNLRHGIGRATSADGSVYRGEFRFNNQHGKGMLISSDGDRYFGDWKVGMQNGVGTYVWSSGSKYTGDWANGDPHGSGTWEDTTSKYIGSWFKGKREGRGKIIRKADHQVIFEGAFKDDEPVQ
eukprot:TRINITY_DN5242_c0_g1_i2.p1 TRINITY_DN5242_c0_g1~~TRINITY_DN5242_c0_g1_i2.p1  ORF type:complete len:225 (+),score=44.49 TRINITY_DN5242_c0_g1_i2:116-790(+)